MIESSNFFNNQNIDASIILGDRYEIFCAAYAAVIYRIPVIHFHFISISISNYILFQFSKVISSNKQSMALKASDVLFPSFGK